MSLPRTIKQNLEVLDPTVVSQQRIKCWQHRLLNQKKKKLKIFAEHEKAGRRVKGAVGRVGDKRAPGGGQSVHIKSGEKLSAPYWKQLNEPTDLRLQD